MPTKKPSAMKGSTMKVMKFAKKTVAMKCTSRKVMKRSSLTKASKQSGTKTAAKVGKNCGRYLTNGFPDPLRNYAGAYADGSKGVQVYPSSPAKVFRSAGAKWIPKRGALGVLKFSDHPGFQPNLTPAEVIKMGSFGGTYFRDIYSAPLGKVCKGNDALSELPMRSWGWDKLDKGIWLMDNSYDVSLNKYGVKCGGSLDMWESSGWINALDPYGWFQWYCRFYLGRRSDDDARQIQRWSNSAGPKGRFRSQVLNKCKSAKKQVTDASVSPVIRQTLQHWGLELRVGM